MMKLSGLSIALILSVALPIATDVTLQQEVLATTSPFDGEFSSSDPKVDYHITLWEENNTYHYKSFNWVSKQKVCLGGGKASIDSDKSIFTWENNGFQYSDSITIRSA